MKNKIVKLNENQFRQMISESVHQVLNEIDWKTYANAARKWADHLEDEPDDPRRKSSIIGHEHSTGRHDIPTDNRLRGFKDAIGKAFNREHGYKGPEGEYGMDSFDSSIGDHGYYNALQTRTSANSKKGGTHHLRDTFNLDAINGKDPYPGKKHEAHASHIDGQWQRGALGSTEPAQAWVDRDAVEPEYDDSNFEYMKARNRGNQDIEDYQSGKAKYIKGQGWTNNNFSVISSQDDSEHGERLYDVYFHGSLEDEIGFDIVDSNEDSNMSYDEIVSNTKDAIRHGEDFYVTDVNVAETDDDCKLVARYDISRNHHNFYGLIVKANEVEDAKKTIMRDMNR